MLFNRKKRESVIIYFKSFGIAQAKRSQTTGRVIGKLFWSDLALQTTESTAIHRLKMKPFAQACRVGMERSRGYGGLSEAELGGRNSYVIEKAEWLEVRYVEFSFQF